MKPSPLRSALLLVALLPAMAGGCGDPAPTDPARDAALRETPPAIPAGSPKVVFLGDSLSAGLHLPKRDAFPQVLQRRLADRALPFALVNAGISGDTTAGGLRRADWLLDQGPEVVVIELGANDGLRGQPLEGVEANLRAIITKVKDAGAVPVLVGMRLPPNYGLDYAAGFRDIFDRLADEFDLAYVPFLLEGVAGRPDLNLPDGIHPTAEGHRRVADNVEPVLVEVLRSLEP